MNQIQFKDFFIKPWFPCVSGDAQLQGPWISREACHGGWIEAFLNGGLLWLHPEAPQRNSRTGKWRFVYMETLSCWSNPGLDLCQDCQEDLWFSSISRTEIRWILELYHYGCHPIRFLFTSWSGFYLFHCRRPHCGLDDSKNIARLVAEMLRQGRIWKKRTQTQLFELTWKPSPRSNIGHPFVPQNYRTYRFSMHCTFPHSSFQYMELGILRFLQIEITKPPQDMIFSLRGRRQRQFQQRCPRCRRRKRRKEDNVEKAELLGVFLGWKIDGYWKWYLSWWWTLMILFKPEVSVVLTAIEIHNV